MCSPSSSSSIRTVPCVAGCDGPNCRCIGSLGTALGSSARDLVRPTRFFSGWSGIWINRLVVSFLVVLAQWMADELLVQIDAAQIGMAGETDSVQIVSLALE